MAWTLNYLVTIKVLGIQRFNSKRYNILECFDLS